MRCTARVFDDIAIVSLDRDPVLYATLDPGRGWRCCHAIAYVERQLPLNGDIFDALTPQGFATADALAEWLEEQLPIHDL